MEFIEGVPSSFIPSFARGLPILVVDRDPISLMGIASLLEQYTFKVTTTELASVALSMIREDKDRFKLVLASMSMEDMDIAAFIRALVQEGIPVIAITSERSVDSIGQALADGACFCLDKPIASGDLKYVWQHVFSRKRRPQKQIKQKKTKKERKNRRRDSQKGIVIREGGSAVKATDTQCVTCGASKCKCKGKEVAVFDDPQGKVKPLDRAMITVEDGDASKGGWKTTPCYEKGCTSKENPSGTYSDLQSAETQSNNNSGKNTSAKKKRLPVVHWTPELHRKFLACISELGDKKARPKTILEKMKEPNLSIHHVSSRLQKYKSECKQLTEGIRAIKPSKTKSTPYLGPNCRLAEAVAKANEAFRAKQRAEFSAGGRNFQASKTTTNVLTPNTGAVKSSQRTDGIVQVYPGMVQKHHYAAGQPNSGNFSGGLNWQTGYMGRSQLLDAARFPNSYSGTVHGAINFLGNSAGHRYQGLNAMPIGYSAPANLHIPNTGLPVVNNGRQEPGTMPLSDHLSNLLNKTPPHPAYTEVMNLLEEEPANFTDKSQNGFNAQIQEKDVNALTESLSNLINPDKSSVAGVRSLNLPNEGGANFQKIDKLPMELGHKNQEPNALRFSDPLAKLFDQDMPQPNDDDMWNYVLEGEPLMIEDSKGPSDMKYQNEGLKTIVDKLPMELGHKNQEPNALRFSDPLASLFDQDLPQPNDDDMWNYILEGEPLMIEDSKGPSDMKYQNEGLKTIVDKLPKESGPKNQEPNASRFSCPLSKLFDEDLPQANDDDIWSIHEGEPLMIEDSKGPSDMMHQNEGLETIVAAAKSSDGLLAPASSSAGLLNEDQDLLDYSNLVKMLDEPMDFEDNFPLDLTNMNQKMDAAAYLDTSAILINDSHQAQQDNAHLSNIIEDEPVDFQGLLGEPNPEDIDLFCQWFTN